VVFETVKGVLGNDNVTHFGISEIMKDGDQKKNVAMKNGGDSSQVIVEHCGDIYYMSGEKEKALEYWKKADSMENKEEDGATPRTEAELKRLKRKIALKKYIE
jgi:hypothetical protein